MVERKAFSQFYLGKLVFGCVCFSLEGQLPIGSLTSTDGFASSAMCVRLIFRIMAVAEADEFM